MTLAIKITYARILAVPFLIFSFYFGKIGVIISAVIFIFASLSDFFDGYIARKRNEVTKLGIFLDPLADKILTTSVLLLLISINVIPTWSVIIILSRELLVNGLRFISIEKKIIIPASFLGKIKTLTQMIALSFILLMYINNYFLFIGNILYWLSFVASIVSGFEYFYYSKNLLK